MIHVKKHFAKQCDYKKEQILHKISVDFKYIDIL